MEKFEQLTKALNDKSCPEFILLGPFIIINKNSIASIIFDSLLNYGEISEDPIVIIYSGTEESKIRKVKISEIIEAIENTKKELA